jgi:hypothetical protein
MCEKECHQQLLRVWINKGNCVNQECWSMAAVATLRLAVQLDLAQPIVLCRNVALPPVSAWMVCFDSFYSSCLVHVAVEVSSYACLHLHGPWKENSSHLSLRAPDTPAWVIRALILMLWAASIPCPWKVHRWFGKENPIACPTRFGFTCWAGNRLLLVSGLYHLIVSGPTP